MSKQHKHELRLHEAAVRLIESTPHARTLDDVARIRGTDWVVLLSVETGMDPETVRSTTSKPVRVQD
jgi:hypothetical protein